MNQLTRREHEVASLAAVGLQVKEIADRLGITHGTAKLHLHNVYTKLGVGSRVKLALTWMKHEQPT
jgi:DNA-binding NarL/FixJ family response regulator